MLLDEDNKIQNLMIKILFSKHSKDSKDFNYEALQQNKTFYEALQQNETLQPNKFSVHNDNLYILRKRLRKQMDNLKISIKEEKLKNNTIVHNTFLTFLFSKVDFYTFLDDFFHKSFENNKHNIAAIKFPHEIKLLIGSYCYMSPMSWHAINNQRKRIANQATILTGK